MKIPYKKIILVSLLPNAIPQEQKQIRLSLTIPPVSDFSVLATEWAKEYLKTSHYSSDSLYWIDFDANQVETQSLCENQDARRRLKSCKLEIEQKNFSIDKVNHVGKGEQMLFWQNHINNSSQPDQGSINKKFSYKDINNIITTKGFRKSLTTGFNAHASGWIPFGNWNIDADFRFNADWNASETNEQRHEENKKIAISEKFIFPPYSKTEITFLLQEANYDLDFSTNVNVGGFFVFKCNSHNNLFIFEPYDILKEIKSYPAKYSEYLKALSKPYELMFEEEGDYRYFKLKYNATGKMQGIYGYQVDSKKQSTPLNNTATPTQTQIVTYLIPNKYASTGLTFLTGFLLFNR